nr:KpsF/GutQ family sugar-phosphate isomerase [Saprospiraceae bacterium]
MSDQQIIAVARDTINIEAKTLAALAGEIDGDFPELVRKIFSSPGRLVVSGIGKSAIVAQKIVATLNSTGTPSLFMHAADAIHGDLGMVGDKDIVLCISKSGETSEIKVLAPLVKSRGNLLIAMTSKKNSYLAVQSDHLLFTPVEQEADPNNLAPTASTTAQMAMGDALAMGLLSLRGFGAADFARYHPGGALGKQLYMRVSDLYKSNERPTVYTDSPLKEIILEISSKRLGMAAVLDRQEKLIGIITDGDLRRMLSSPKPLQEVSAEQIMTKNPKTTAPDTMAMKALNAMKEYSITQLIVAENDQYLGVVHLHDFLREGLV